MSIFTLRHLSLLLISALVLLHTGCGPDQSPQGGGNGAHEMVFSVELGEVSTGSITQSVSIVGTTLYGRRSLIRSEVEGLVTSNN